MSSFRKLFPTLKTNYTRGQSCTLGSNATKGLRNGSMEKFTLRNIQRLNESYTEDEPQAKLTKERKNKASLTRIPTLSDQSSELLQKAKQINNKYFHFTKPTHQIRASTDKENSQALHSIKRYKSFRSKWFQERAD